MKNANLKSLLTVTATWPADLAAMDSLVIPSRPETLHERGIVAFNPHFEIDEDFDHYDFIPFDAASYTGLPELLPAGADDVITIDMGAKNRKARWWLGLELNDDAITGSRAALLDIFCAFCMLKADFICHCDGFISDIAVANELRDLLLAGV